MHAYDLILTLTGGLAAALVLGYVTQRLGLSPIVGYSAGRHARRPAHARASSPTPRWPSSSPRSA